MSERGLTTKQQLFIEHYLGAANGNASEAARLAGYKQPRAHGSRLLTNDDIASRVRARVDEAAMTADEVLAGLAVIARDVSAEARDRIKAYELIGKNHKLFSDRVIHQGDDTAPPIQFIEAVRPEGV